MVRMSRTRGMRHKRTGSFVSRHAASAGSAEFLAPLIGSRLRAASRPESETCPCSAFRAPLRSAPPPATAEPAAAAAPDSTFSRAITIAVFTSFPTLAAARPPARNRLRPASAMMRLARSRSFVVLGLDVHHQVAIHVSQPDHHRRLIIFSTSLVAVPAFIARRAGDHFRARQRRDRDVHSARPAPNPACN